MMLSLDDVVRNAVVIDVNGDIYSETYRHDEMLKQGITLLSAYRDSETIVPVQLLVKEMKDGSGQLYMAVTVKKIEAGIISTPATAFAETNGDTPASIVNVAQLVKEVNPSEGELFKHFPDSMLSTDQKKSKQEAILREKEKIDKMRAETDPVTKTRIYPNGNEEFYDIVNLTPTTTEAARL